jgi:hypothetical protein
MPRLFRYTVNPDLHPTMLTRMRVHAIDEWVHLILTADWN